MRIFSKYSHTLTHALLTHLSIDKGEGECSSVRAVDAFFLFILISTFIQFNISGMLFMCKRSSLDKCVLYGENRRE